MPGYSLRDWTPPAAIVGAAVGIGAVSATYPHLAIVLAPGILGASAAFVAADRLPRIFIGALGVLLVGYACFGRAFSYLGAPPLFVGELVLAIGLAAMFGRTGLPAVLRMPVAWLWIALAICGTAGTLPYVRTYGFNAFRDAAIWGYGIYALIVAACLLRLDDPRLVSHWYGRWVFWFMLWAPFAWYFGKLPPGWMPKVPGSTVDVLTSNPGDMGVHLGGAAAFVLLGLTQRPDGSRKPALHLPPSVFWSLWFVVFALVASWTRGGGMAALIAVLAVLVARPVLASRLTWFGIAGTAVVVTFLAFDITIDTGDYRGKISPKELTANLASAFRDDPNNSEERGGNKEWRLDWWRTIIGYTVQGDRFWTGKGYGVNLANDDGFQVEPRDALRSPHSAHFTFLARSGVPGIVLWATLQAVFVLSVLRAYLRARRAREEGWQRLDIWILAYWLAFQVNASFDVYIEGPHGGIWFWSLMGFGMWAVHAQRRLPPAPARVSR